ncbi:hypothetical protein ACFE04_025050 [Oxalis oulophora]
MVLSTPNALSSKSIFYSNNTHSLSIKPLQPTFAPLPTNNQSKPRSLHRISAVHDVEPAKIKGQSSTTTTTATPLRTGKWSVDSWKTKKALQLPEYLDANDLESDSMVIQAILSTLHLPVPGGVAVIAVIDDWPLILAGSTSWTAEIRCKDLGFD